MNSRCCSARHRGMQAMWPLCRNSTKTQVHRVSLRAPHTQQPSCHVWTPLLHTPPWCPIPAAYLAPRRACLAALPPATGRSTKLTTSSNTLSTAAAWPPSWHKSRPSRSAASTCTRGAAEGHVVDKLRRPSMCSRQKPFTMHPRQQMASLCVWRLPPTAAAAAPCGRRTAA